MCNEPTERRLGHVRIVVPFPRRVRAAARELDDWFGAASRPGIRAVAPGSFPPINVGTTPASVEIYAFAPGIDAGKVEVSIDRGVLTLAGERDTPQAADSESQRLRP